MKNEEKIREAITEAKSILRDIAEPEKSLSFPIVLSFLLNGDSEVVKKPLPEKSISNDKQGGEENFKGLTGGIRLMIQEGFFKEERSQGDIFAELERQGYRYPKTSLPPILISFVHQKRILNRKKGSDGNWRYAERK